MPCPLGAFCPRAWPADGPATYLQEDPDFSKQLVGKADKWCAPYAYKLRPALGCGGADKWTIQPEDSFPRVWWEAGSGSIYCDGGSYCPNPLQRLPCKEGHFCKRGSSRMTACPALASCPAGTETPTDNWLGFVLDGCLFLLLGLLWNVSQMYNHVMRRLSSRERVKVMWHKSYPKITVVQVAEEQPSSRYWHTGSAASTVSTSGLPGIAAPEISPEQAHQAAANAGTAAASSSRSRFGFIGGFTRRRRSGAGGAPVWASFDDERDGHYIPLLECELGAEAIAGAEPSRPRHTRNISSVVLAPSSTLILEPMSLQPTAPQAAAGGRGRHRRTYSAEKPMYAGTGASTAAQLDRNSSLENKLVLPSRRRGSDSSEHVVQQEQGQECNVRPSAGASGCHRPMLDVGFQDLSMRLKSCGKMVLQGVTGGLHPGRLAAIMGPSGAGKSSLMTAIAGKASYGKVSGVITINGKADRVEHYKHLMGFVPQDDIMYRQLTVEENLTYSARFRLPASTGQAERLEMVANAIDVLGLGDVRGISGGQRKRVNVGIELVADPLLLFLDEPTSGLDSTASKLVVQALRRVALKGVTVAAVIHQPSYETFCLFDDLVLLAKGGRTAFCGPQASVQAYFEGLMFEVPAHVNPADAFLDIISGAILPSSGSQLDLADCWSKAQGTQQAAAGAAGNNAELLEVEEELLVLTPGSSSTDMLMLSNFQGGGAGHHEGKHLGTGGISRVTAEVACSIQPRQQAGFARQFYWVLTRAVLMRTRDPMLVFIEYMIFAITGSFLGLMSDRGRGSIGSYVGNVVYNIVALGMMSTVSGIKTFGGPDRLVYFREASAGLNKLAYFWALDTWGHTDAGTCLLYCLAGMLLRCGVYLIMYYSFSQPRAVLWQMYLVTCAIYYACTGMAYLLSQVMSPNAAQLTAAVAALINALVASKFATSGVMGILNNISYARHGLEGYVIAEANCLTGVWLLARCADLAAFSYSVTRFWTAIKLLLYIGLSSRFAACLSLLTLQRDKTV
eukprot:gene10763-10919_t